MFKESPQKTKTLKEARWRNRSDQIEKFECLGYVMRRNKKMTEPCVFSGGEKSLGCV